MVDQTDDSNENIQEKPATADDKSSDTDNSIVKDNVGSGAKDSTTDVDEKSEKVKPSSNADSTELKKKTLSITIKDDEVLYAAYMPFLKTGGLFIPTKKKFTMGDELTLLITLPGSTERHKVDTRVVWLTPVGSPGNKAAGVGVMFSEDPDGEAFRLKIEHILGTKLQSNDATHTM